MQRGGRAEDADEILRVEREFVQALGGYSIGLSGGTLVLHDHVPVPRFNFATVAQVGPLRQTAFFERALDQYFQRALRPTFRVARPVPPHVARTLVRLGFRPRSEPLDLLIGRRPGPRVPTAAELVADEEIESAEIARRWMTDRERPELTAALETLRSHPNPDERLLPVVARLGGAPAATALVYRHRTTATLFGVITDPSVRGRGLASALTDWVRRARPLGRTVRYTIISENPRLTRRLRAMGFDRVRSLAVYELPDGAILETPALGPPGPPRWRPPRTAVPGG